MSFTWVNGRQLGALQKGDLGVSYSYNSDGLRVSKTVNGAKTEYVWDGSSLIGQKTGNNVLVYLYAADGLAGFQYNGVNYYYLKNGQGDVVAILNASGNIVAKYAYDAWGNLLSVTDATGADKSADSAFIGNINPVRYRSYYYDTETGLYYLQSRYYDPEVGRFINADSAIGVNGDIHTYNLFTYCGSNPINRYEVGGMFWKELFEGIKNVASSIIHTGNNIAVNLGIDTAAIGAAVLDMEKDSRGVYHASFDCWQQYFGYNDLYDIVFDIGTSMATAKFPFSYNGTNYILWAWKGDYINLGAGAELGIYCGNDPHWLVDKNLAMPMGLTLRYEDSIIISHSETTWWITGFNPKYQNVNANQLEASFFISFNDIGMYNAFYGKYKDDSRWFFCKSYGYRFAVLSF